MDGMQGALTRRNLRSIPTRQNRQLPPATPSPSDRAQQLSIVPASVSSEALKPQENAYNQAGGEKLDTAAQKQVEQQKVRHNIRRCIDTDKILKPEHNHLLVAIHQNAEQGALKPDVPHPEQEYEDLYEKGIQNLVRGLHAEQIRKDVMTSLNTSGILTPEHDKFLTAIHKTAEQVALTLSPDPFPNTYKFREIYKKTYQQGVEALLSKLQASEKPQARLEEGEEQKVRLQDSEKKQIRHSIRRNLDTGKILTPQHNKDLALIAMRAEKAASSPTVTSFQDVYEKVYTEGVGKLIHNLQEKKKQQIRHSVRNLFDREKIIRPHHNIFLQNAEQIAHKKASENNSDRSYNDVYETVYGTQVSDLVDNINKQYDKNKPALQEIAQNIRLTADPHNILGDGQHDLLLQAVEDNAHAKAKRAELLDDPQQIFEATYKQGIKDLVDAVVLKTEVPQEERQNLRHAIRQELDPDNTARDKGFMMLSLIEETARSQAINQVDELAEKYSQLRKTDPASFQKIGLKAYEETYQQTYKQALETFLSKGAKECMDWMYSQERANSIEGKTELSMEERQVVQKHVKDSVQSSELLDQTVLEHAEKQASTLAFQQVVDIKQSGGEAEHEFPRKFNQLCFANYARTYEATYKDELEKAVQQHLSKLLDGKSGAVEIL